MVWCLGQCLWLAAPNLLLDPFGTALLHLPRNANEPRQSPPMPRMRSAAPCPDVSGIRLGNVESRRDGRVRDSGEPRLNPLLIGLIVEPSRLAGWQPALAGDVMAALCG